MLSPYNAHLMWLGYDAWLHASSFGCKATLQLAHIIQRLIMLHTAAIDICTQICQISAFICTARPCIHTHESRQASMLYRDVQAIIVEDEGCVYAGELRGRHPERY